MLLESFLFWLVYLIRVWWKLSGPIEFLKALPLLTIILYFPRIISFKTKHERFVFAGLIFSLIGDIFLQHSIDKFIPGLLSFACAHVCYCIAFSSVAKSKSRLADILIPAIPSILIMIPFVKTLFNTSLWWLLFFMAGYCFVLASAMWRSFCLLKKTKGANWFGFVGMIFFSTSDIILSVERFILSGILKGHPIMETIIISTYWLAQCFVSHSLVPELPLFISWFSDVKKFRDMYNKRILNIDNIEAVKQSKPIDEKEQ
eukprot:gnl/Carplike_NY0171/2601_a3491_514.p1 GENE.gnl/Carplike_NY0171/2601_a3491_514~~gnl/Carplike_NY0171/2601_a3491_514.p1  ORF type:complete len:259 (+),score=41.34 gnl/Carplike_NY0171/2601_a3491_514:34-810(+)